MARWSVSLYKVQCIYAAIAIGKHSIFGRVCSGIAVVNRMGMVEVDKNDRFAVSSCHLIFYFCL